MNATVTSGPGVMELRRIAHDMPYRNESGREDILSSRSNVC